MSFQKTSRIFKNRLQISGKHRARTQAEHLSGALKAGAPMLKCRPMTANFEMADSSKAAFPVAETHRIALRSGNKLITHSANLGWRNLYASLATESTWAATLHPVDHPCFVYCLRRSAQIRRRISGSASAASALLEARQFSIIPAHVESHWEVRGEPEILLVYLRRSMIDRIAEEYFGKGPQRIEILPRLADSDPLLEQLALSTVAALRSQDETDNAYYVDSLAHMITVQLLARHSDHPNARDRQGGTFGRTTDHPALSRAREYIEACIDGDLSLDALTAQTKVSSRYLTRLFREHLGESPHRYVLSRRIERARHLLQTTEIPIADIAFSAGFSSQSHLTSAFRKFIGVSPGRYRYSRDI